MREALTTERLRRHLYECSAAGLRPRSIRSNFYPLRGLIRFLRCNGAIEGDPMTGISMPALDAPIRHTVSDQECALILAACDRLRDRRKARMVKAMLSVLIYCGLRAAEVVALKLGNYSADKGTLTVVHGKGKKNRTLFPTPDTIAAIEAWLLVRSAPPKQIGSDWMWAYEKRRKVAYAGLCGLLDELKHIAGLADRDNIHLHALRRGFATRLMAAGATIKAIQAALGHSDPTITFAYLADANEPARAMQNLARLVVPAAPPAEPTRVIEAAQAGTKQTRADHMMRRRRLPAGG